MFEVLVDGVWVEKQPFTGDVVRQWFGEGEHRHFIQYDSYVHVQEEDRAREWRNNELNRTDIYMVVSDYPYKTEMSVYRQQLRDWPTTENFPSVKPVAP